MPASYLYIGLFLLVAIIITSVTLLLPVFLRYVAIVPRKPSPVKNANFECGMETMGKTWVQFNFRYYSYALIFLVIDVLVVFLYPWAVTLKQLGYYSFFGVLVLISVVFVGYLYAWKKKVLEWK